MKQMTRTFWKCFLLVAISSLACQACSILPVSKIDTAARNGSDAEVERLIQAGADVNSNAGRWGRTPLHTAAFYGHTKTAQLLLQKGAYVNGRDGSRNTPLHMTVDKGKDKSKGHPETAELLIKNGADVNARNAYGGTSLMWASSFGYYEVAQLLIQNGADLNTANERGTALDRALQRNNKKMADLLRKHGASESGSAARAHANNRGSYGVSDSRFAFLDDVYHRDQFGQTPLFMAVFGGSVTEVERLLQKGADVNAKADNGQTPLMWAARHGRDQVAQLLIQKGADVHAKDNKGHTPLFWAAGEGPGEGRYKTAQLLIQNGADVNVKAGKYGSTPLHSAVFFGYTKMVQLLIQNGADVNAKDIKSRTPLQRAILGKKEKVADLLRKHGAKE